MGVTEQSGATRLLVEILFILFRVLLRGDEKSAP